jgi:hypothetical protein
VHPSSILRADDDVRDAETKHFVADLKKAAKLLP